MPQTLLPMQIFEKIPNKGEDQHKGSRGNLLQSSEVSNNNEESSYTYFRHDYRYTARILDVHIE